MSRLHSLQKFNLVHQTMFLTRGNVGSGNEPGETVWLLEENCLVIGGKLSGYVGSGNETREKCLVMWVLGTRLGKTVWLCEMRLSAMNILSPVVAF